MLDPNAVGLVNDASRESMGKLLEGQLGVVNEAFSPGGNALHKAAGDELNRVLGEVAASPEAYARMVNAERAYVAVQLDAAATVGDMTALAEHAERMGGLQAQLDHGRKLAIDAEWGGKEDAYNDRVNAVGDVGGYALSKAVSVVPLGGLAADGISAVTSGTLNALVESSKVDYGAHAAAESARMYGDSRGELIRMTESVIWEQQAYETSKPVPEELLRDGKPIPLAEIRGTPLGHVYDDWKAGNEGFSGSARNVLRDVEASYYLGAETARQSQSGGGA